MALLQPLTQGRAPHCCPGTHPMAHKTVSCPHIPLSSPQVWKQVVKEERCHLFKAESSIIFQAQTNEVVKETSGITGIEIARWDFFLLSLQHPWCKGLCHTTHLCDGLIPGAAWLDLSSMETYLISFYLEDFHKLPMLE